MTPLFQSMVNFSLSQDLTSNMILNIIWFMTTYNNIEQPANITEYNFNQNNLFQLLEEDLLNLRATQSFLEDNRNNIADITNRKGQTASSYFNYLLFDENSRISVKKFDIDVAFEKFIGNFNKFLFLKNYTIENSERFFIILNPYVYLKKYDIKISDLEKRFLEVLKNGIELVRISNQNLKEMIAFIQLYVQETSDIILYLNVSAIAFTIIFCIVLVICFNNLIRLQEDCLSTFAKVDFVYGVKANCVCDKFIDMINISNNTLVENNNGLIRKFKSFYGKLCVKLDNNYTLLFNKISDVTQKKNMPKLQINTLPIRSKDHRATVKSKKPFDKSKKSIIIKNSFNKINIKKILNGK